MAKASVPAKFGGLMLILITAYTISFVPALFVAEDGREQKNTCVKPIICVGVFTDGGGVPRYADRRAALRATWFPSTPGALKDVECTYGITVRFVVGNGELTNDTIAIRAYHAELKEHGDFFRLDVLDTYPAMTGKTSKMFRQVLSLPEEYQYAIKIDDDMYVSLAHLSKAAEQWTAMGVDYVGCMNHPGIIYKTEGQKWYEPLHDILAPNLHMYACGPSYALSRTAMMYIFKDGNRSNRFLAVEDQSMGLWMIAHNVTYFDDRRLCATDCHSSAAFVAVKGHGRYCDGLNESSIQLHALHATPECRAAPPRQLPFVHSPTQRFNNMIRAYERRRSGTD